MSITHQHSPAKSRSPRVTQAQWWCIYCGEDHKTGHLHCSEACLLEDLAEAKRLGQSELADRLSNLLRVRRFRDRRAAVQS